MRRGDEIIGFRTDPRGPKPWFVILATSDGAGSVFLWRAAALSTSSAPSNALRLTRAEVRNGVQMLKWDATRKCYFIVHYRFGAGIENAEIVRLPGATWRALGKRLRQESGSWWVEDRILKIN
jgi:hypothetical protein